MGFVHHRVQDKLFGLAADFARYGWSQENGKRYQGLDQVVTEIALGAARKVGQRKDGYTRSGPLTIYGRFLIIHKMMLDYKSRGQSGAMGHGIKWV